MGNLKITGYAILRLAGGKFKNSRTLKHFDVTNRNDFIKWCKENFHALDEKYGGTLEMQELYSDGSFSYISIPELEKRDEFKKKWKKLQPKVDQATLEFDKLIYGDCQDAEEFAASQTWEQSLNGNFQKRLKFGWITADIEEKKVIVNWIFESILDGSKTASAEISMDKLEVLPKFLLSAYFCWQGTKILKDK